MAVNHTQPTILSPQSRMSKFTPRSGRFVHKASSSSVSPVTTTIADRESLYEGSASHGRSVSKRLSTISRPSGRFAPMASASASVSPVSKRSSNTRHSGRFVPMASASSASTTSDASVLSAPLQLDCISELPIYAHLDEFITAVNAMSYPICIGASTGAGKTVGLGCALAKNCHENKGRKVYFSLPTRAAVISARESLLHFCPEYASDPAHAYFGFAQNREVDYVDETFVKYATTRHVINVIVRALACKTDTSAFDNMVIVVDEAHYQNADTRVLLLLCSYLYKKYPGKFCPVIASATLDNAPIDDLFDAGTELVNIEVKGRLFPIKTIYDSRDYSLYETSDMLNSTAHRVNYIAKHGSSGSILVFCSGEGEITKISKYLDVLRTPAKILRAYGKMNTEEYEELFKSHSGRVIILATNVAETSVTIPNVVHVVDTLRQKTVYEVGQGKKINEEMCSIPASIQRRGRAGRLRAGIYHPMATEAGIDDLPKRDSNELERTHPDDFILMFMRYMLDTPQIRIILRLEDAYFAERIEYLTSKGTIETIDGMCGITKLGSRIIDLPTTIEGSLCLFESESYSITTQIFACMMIAMITSGNTLVWTPHKLSKNERNKYMREWFGRFIGFTDVETNFKYFIAMHFEGSSDYVKWSGENSFNNKVLRQSRRMFITLTKMIISHRISCIDDIFRMIDWSEIGFNPDTLLLTKKKKDYSTVDFHPVLMGNLAECAAKGFNEEIFQIEGSRLERVDDDTHVSHSVDTKRSQQWGFNYSAPYSYRREFKDEDAKEDYSLDRPRRYARITSSRAVCINSMTITMYPRGVMTQFNTVSWILLLPNEDASQ